MSELRIELTAAERYDLCSDTIAIIFSIWAGKVSICEEWAGQDELYASSVCITIPARIWAEGSAWLAEQACKP